MPTPTSVSRAADATLLNARGQDFRLYVGFGNEIRIVTDARLVTPPETYYPQNFGKAPDRPSAIFGPNRIGFVGEALHFYGGRSARRLRGAAVNHVWKVFRDGVDVTANTTYVESVVITDDEYQTYRSDPQPAICDITFAQGGIYEVRLTVAEEGSEVQPCTHTGIRQVIVYDSRESASTGVVEIGNLSGSVSQGGWSCSLRVRGDLSFLLNARQVEGYIPVVIAAETRYLIDLGGPVWVSETIGPNWHVGDMRDDPSIIFNGYIESGSITIDFDKSEASFSCRTADMILEQMQTHVVGFFESANDGKGVTFNDLTVGDVYRYMLLEKSNFGDYHDLRLYHNAGYLPEGSNWSVDMAGDPAGGGTYTVDSDQIPNMEYRDWTFNQGQYWSNIRDGADNQFERAFVDNTGALCVWPDRNMWYPQVWFDHTSVNNWTGSSYNGSKYIGFGLSLEHDLVPVGPEDTPLGTICSERNPAVLLGELAGPWDTLWWDGAPVSVPIRLTVSERLSAVPSYYKLVGNLTFWNEEWGADYPKNATDSAQGQWLLPFLSNPDRRVRVRVDVGVRRLSVECPRLFASVHDGLPLSTADVVALLRTPSHESLRVHRI